MSRLPVRPLSQNGRGPSNILEEPILVKLLTTPSGNYIRLNPQTYVGTKTKNTKCVRMYVASKIKCHIKSKKSS